MRTLSFVRYTADMLCYLHGKAASQVTNGIGREISHPLASESFETPAALHTHFPSPGSLCLPRCGCLDTLSTHVARAVKVIIGYVSYRNV